MEKLNEKPGVGVAPAKEERDYDSKPVSAKDLAELDAPTSKKQTLDVDDHLPPIVGKRKDMDLKVARDIAKFEENGVRPLTAPTDDYPKEKGAQV
jgi:hypothetical protein